MSEIVTEKQHNLQTVTGGASCCCVRELTVDDIPSILNYWETRSDENLIKMGCDIQKVRSFNSSEYSSMLMTQLALPYEQRTVYFVIWMYNDQPIGHSNMGKIQFGEEGTMHLHIWDTYNRQRGIGQEMVKKSLALYFQNFQLKRVICEPNALNEAPNKTLSRVGFEYIKDYQPEPGFFNFPHIQSRWEMSRERFESLDVA